MSAVPFVTIACPRCGRFSDIRQDHAYLARCQHCNYLLSALHSGIDWPSVARAVIAAVLVAAIMLGLSALMVGAGQ